MKVLKGEILANKKYGENLYKIDIFSPFICKNAKPGHFVNVKCALEGSLDPLLRRPLSIYEVDSQFNVFSILYLVKGRGTAFLAKLRKGDVLDFVGPLGNSFEIDEDLDNYALVGGGIGIAPLYFIAKELTDLGKNCLFLAGFKDSTFYSWERDLIKILRNFKIFTEDGSSGDPGTPVDYIRKNMKDLKKYSFVICGPKEMLKALKDLFSGKKVKALAFMEERMACGLGTCLGCVIRLKNENGSFDYRRVCSDGPIFDLMEVMFD